VCFFINNIHALAISTIGRRFLFCHLDDFDALILNNVDDRKIFFAVNLPMFCFVGKGCLFEWQNRIVMQQRELLFLCLHEPTIE
jgi:Holliday junction resolvasome RuvABC ATP-dependent DNA helicase subunit